MDTGKVYYTGRASDLQLHVYIVADVF